MKQSFQDRVYEIAKKIPPGKVVTYKQLAQMSGSQNAARAVGVCMKNNPNPKIIPCHRVVASNGKLTGYAFGDGITTKKAILLKEGVSFVHDRVRLSVSQWKPNNAYYSKPLNKLCY